MASLLLSSACAATGNRTNASRASTDGSTKKERAELRGGRRRAPCIPRKVRGIGGVPRSDPPDRGSGADRRWLFAELPAYRRTGRLAGCGGPSGARSGRPHVPGTAVLLGFGTAS